MAKTARLNAQAGSKNSMALGELERRWLGN